MRQNRKDNRMKKLWVAMVINLLLGSQSWAAANTIAAFGDSLFSGYGLAAEDSFPAQLERRLKADGYDVTIINNGVTGETTAGGVGRVDQVVAQKPDIILVEFGANDLLQRVQPAEVRKNLETIMSRIKQANIRMMLIGMKAPFTAGPAYADAYNALFPELATTYGAGFYPFFLEGVYGKPELMQPDTVHPTKEGIAVMVANMYPLVTSGLRK